MGRVRHADSQPEINPANQTPMYDLWRLFAPTKTQGRPTHTTKMPILDVSCSEEHSADPWFCVRSDGGFPKLCVHMNPTAHPQTQALELGTAGGGLCGDAGVLSC